MTSVSGSIELSFPAVQMTGSLLCDEVSENLTDAVAESVVDA